MSRSPCAPLPATWKARCWPHYLEATRTRRCLESLTQNSGAADPLNGQGHGQGPQIHPAFRKVPTVCKGARGTTPLAPHMPPPCPALVHTFAGALTCPTSAPARSKYSVLSRASYRWITHRLRWHIVTSAIGATPNCGSPLPQLEGPHRSVGVNHPNSRAPVRQSPQNLVRPCWPPSPTPGMDRSRWRSRAEESLPFCDLQKEKTDHGEGSCAHVVDQTEETCVGSASSQSSGGRA